MGLSQFGVSPGRQKVVAILDFETVTLISNEGSSLALHSSSDSRAAVNRPVRGIAERAAPMVKKKKRVEKNLGTKPPALWSNADTGQQKKECKKNSSALPCWLTVCLSHKMHLNWLSTFSH